MSGQISPSFPRFAAVVLAAGASRRMGQPKALLPLAGRPLVAHVVENCQSTGFIRPVVVVTGHEPHGVEGALEHLDVVFVHNDGFEAGGMLSSVKAGLPAAAHAANLDGIFIVLCDQPSIKPTTFQALSAAWCGTRSAVVRPEYHGKHGHPILIASRCVDLILQLSADQSLQDFVHAQQANCIDVPVDDPAILMDLDTPADYERALKSLEFQSRVQQDRSSTWTAEDQKTRPFASVRAD